MSLVGLELDASRARAVIGPASHRLGLVSLETDQPELPLHIDMDGRTPQVGRAGFSLLRQRPYQVCSDFLPALSTNRVWHCGTHRLDPPGALGLVFSTILQKIGKNSGVTFTLPAYLGDHQIAELYEIARGANLQLLGSLAAPVAAVLASPVGNDPGGGGIILAVESDGFGLTWSAVERANGMLRLRFVQPSPGLGRWTWIRRLVDGVADRCVRQCRRDPRESAQTEQLLFEQLVRTLDQPTGNLIQVHVQGSNWSHHLMLHADELLSFITPQVRLVFADLDVVTSAVERLGPLSAVVVTHPAGGLPGLVPVLRARMQALKQDKRDTAAEVDFGELLLSSASSGDNVHVLAPDALACTAHELAVRIHRGDFPNGHLDAIALPGSGPAPVADTGPARLNFRGEDHILSRSPFTLGRDPGSDMVFETEMYPHVSGRHAEIIFDRRAYVLYDRSRHGTWLNDQRISQQQALHSGDWIRLGPLGPVLCFLGQAPEQQQGIMTKGS